MKIELNPKTVNLFGKMEISYEENVEVECLDLDEEAVKNMEKSIIELIDRKTLGDFFNAKFLGNVENELMVSWFSTFPNKENNSRWKYGIMIKACGKHILTSGMRVDPRTGESVSNVLIYN